MQVDPGVTKFFSEVVTWYWVLSVALTGIVINLASAYIKDPMDRAFGKISQRRKLMTEKKMDRLYKLCDQMQDSEFRSFIRWRSQIEAIRGIMCILFIFGGVAGMYGVSAFFVVDPRALFNPLQAALALLVFAAAYGFFSSTNSSQLLEKALRMYEDIRLPFGIEPSAKTDGLMERLNRSGE